MSGRALARAALLVLVPLAASARTTPVSLREIRQGLFGTCFATDRDGWMVGELGRIFHTADGGETWERQDAGTKRRARRATSSASSSPPTRVATARATSAP